MGWRTNSLWGGGLIRYGVEDQFVMGWRTNSLWGGGLIRVED